MCSIFVDTRRPGPAGPEQLLVLGRCFQLVELLIEPGLEGLVLETVGLSLALALGCVLRVELPLFTSGLGLFDELLRYLGRVKTSCFSYGTLLLKCRGDIVPLLSAR